MRKTNGKLFLALLVGVVVLTGAVFAVHYFQYQRIARALLFQARRAEEKGDKAEEAKFRQLYLEFNPRDPDETAALARLWAGDGYPVTSKQKRQAVELMDQVLAYQDDPELRRLLVKTALQVRPRPDLRRATEHLERLLPRKELDKSVEADKAARKAGKPIDPDFARPDAARGELEGYWGMILEEGKETVAALHCHRLAILHAPETTASYLRLASLLRRENEPDPQQKVRNQAEADRVVEALVQKNPDAHESYLTRWGYRREFNLLSLRDGDGGHIELEKAGEDVTKALRMKPESIEVLLAAADLERLRGRAAAEDSSRPALDRRALTREHRDRAARHLERGQEIVAHNLAATTDYGRFQLLWHQANLLLDRLDSTRAEADEENKPEPDVSRLKDQIRGAVEQIRRVPVASAAPSADYVLGRLLVHDREWRDAAKLFEGAKALMQEQPEMVCQANLYLGQCYEKLEEHTQMFSAFKRVIEWDPNSVPALMGMAVAR